MTTRRAACSCGQLHLICEGEPARISMCHCLECQRRTGGIFASQARFPRDRVIVTGRSTQFVRSSDSGNEIAFHFCPVCGSTVFWEGKRYPDMIYVAVGSFADPAFPPPSHSVWESRRHEWVETLGEMPIEHRAET